MSKEKTVCTNLWVLIGFAFPMLESWYANKKLRAKLVDESGILAHTENADKVTLANLKEQYDDTIRAKDKLEDKAKTNVAGVTIAVTLIMGASNMLGSILKKYPISIFKWGTFLLLMGAIAYLIIAGILSIRVLIAENLLFTITLDSIIAGDDKLKMNYDKSIAKNRTQNLIRNNCIYASYGCVRNALVCLFIIFLASTIPLNMSPNSSEQYGGRRMYDIVYSSKAVSSLGDIVIQDRIENRILVAIEDHPSQSSDSTVGVIDMTDQLFIQYTLTGKTVTVNMIEPYLTP